MAKKPTEETETPKTKLQTPKKSQVPSSKPRPALRAWNLELGASLVFGVWDLELLWCLVFGALVGVVIRFAKSAALWQGGVARHYEKTHHRLGSGCSGRRLGLPQEGIGPHGRPRGLVRHSRRLSFCRYGATGDQLHCGGAQGAVGAAGNPQVC